MIMEKKIVISVIIPVYNAQEFIDRAVESVLCQMDGSIELILVDDGSKDRSGEICDEYAKNYDNVRVIHKENGGLSSARNAGISAASGEYLSFLDADDYLDPDTCETVKTVITSYHPDLIDFGWRYINNGEIMPDRFHNLPKNVLLGERELFNLILPPLLNLRNDPNNFVFDFVWNKIFKIDIIQSNNLLFDENRCTWEDRPFVVNYLKYCNSYYGIDKCFYNYVSVPGSLSRKYSMDFFRIIIENFNLYRDLFGNKYNFDTQYVNNYWCHSIENAIFLSLEQQDNKQKIRENILETLQNEQVIYWYINRQYANNTEKKLSKLVGTGKIEQAITVYTKCWKTKQCQNKSLLFIRSAKRRISKIITGR